MSLKPPKKSDLKKPWMNKPDRAIKIRPEYHLIVMEKRHQRQRREQRYMSWWKG